jgi:sterol desaturase/sphingolipid hydroxylase (fatty acid hydroxylase superfamily)
VIWRVRSTQVLLKHRGKDISRVFRGQSTASHAHSEAAHRLLEEYCIGRLNGLDVGEWQEENLENNLHRNDTANLSRAIDSNKPVIPQLAKLTPMEYKEWVYSPVPGHPRFFDGWMLESATKVRWWVVPLTWIPLVIISIWKSLAAGLSGRSFLCFFPLGLLAWQWMEYSLHRFVFHSQPKTPTQILLHFLLHGCHHKYPMDTERLVFPPLPASLVIGAVFSLLQASAPRPIAWAIFAGMLGGYVCYDCIHYFIHSGRLGGGLKATHMKHHFASPSAGFGISSPLFDMVFSTKSNIFY